MLGPRSPRRWRWSALRSTLDLIIIDMHEASRRADAEISSCLASTLWSEVGRSQQGEG